MWAYLNKNQENYQFELSQKACAEWGIKKDSYYSAVKDLIDRGYLVPITPYSNIYNFHEIATSEIPIYFSENENTASENPIISSEKTYRNNINNTIILQNKTNGIPKKRDNALFDERCKTLKRFLDYGMNDYTFKEKFELKELLQKEKYTEAEKERLEYLYRIYIDY